MTKATLENKYQHHESRERRNIIKKLNSLSNRNILLPGNNDCFINLSDYNINECKKEALNLGLNCHIKKIFNFIEKKIEISMLYSSLLKLEENDKIRINLTIKKQLRAESTRQRSKDGSKFV